MNDLSLSHSIFCVFSEFTGKTKIIVYKRIFIQISMKLFHIEQIFKNKTQFTIVIAYSYMSKKNIFHVIYFNESYVYIHDSINT